MNAYLIIIGKEATARNYSAFSPDVPGCITVGDTVEDTLRHMQEALRTHLEGILEDGEDIPEPQPFEVHLFNEPELQDNTLIFARIPVDEVAPFACV